MTMVQFEVSSTFSPDQNLLLDVRNLSVKFKNSQGLIVAVNRVSFGLQKGEVLGLVGESGSGKTLTALSILKLLPSNAMTEGDVLYHKIEDENDTRTHGEWQNLSKLKESQLRNLRGNEIAMVFQDPLSSLNPVQRTGDQIVEAIRLHNKIARKDAWRQAVELLSQVGIQSPEKRARNFPHQLSGGMRQRVMIAMALSCRPKVLIADEPTTMIDEISQMQIIELLKRIKRNFGGILYITHDLGIVAELCTRVVVMYAGRIMEIGDVKTIFARPKHPYTKMLIDSIPRVDRDKQKLISIPGTIVGNLNPKSECRFASRCPYVVPKCNEDLPELENTADPSGHFTACIRWKEIF